jgi:hypothetical protein
MRTISRPEIMAAMIRNGKFTVLRDYKHKRLRDKLLDMTRKSHYPIHLHKTSKEEMIFHLNPDVKGKAHAPDTIERPLGSDTQADGREQ